jgi:Protein of unknown function (DUF1566)
MTRRQRRCLFMAIPAAWALGWAGAAGAATCEEDLAICTAGLQMCENDLLLKGRALTNCNTDVGFAQQNLASCNASLSEVQADLVTCNHDLAVCQALGFPASGQTTAFPADRNDGIPGPVAVPDDGTLEAGVDLLYIDNGDGTITDPRTGLMWEKKSDDGGLHDKDNIYWWSGNGAQETVWDWLEDINSQGISGFAGYHDWRIPSVKELLSIVNYQNPPAAVSSAFNKDCVPGATVSTGSCTFLHDYWSSSTWAANAGYAWTVSFNHGSVSRSLKADTARARAVRGGTP